MHNLPMSRVTPWCLQLYTDWKRQIMASKALYGEKVVITGDCFIIELIKLTQKRRIAHTSITIEVMIHPWNIAIDSDSNFVYTDRYQQTIFLLKNNETHVLLTVRDWRPLNVCITLNGDLLVIMDSCDLKQTKVVRYSGTRTEENKASNLMRRGSFSFIHTMVIIYHREQEPGYLCS